MTNPDNIVRVRARNGGRASVLEANAWCQTLNTGLLEGNGVIQNTSADMNVLVGGSTAKPDVIIAQNPAGYKVALDIVGQQAVAITAPATNSRISAIVAYTDDLSLTSEDTTVTGSPSSCGLIVVNGTTSANPVAPSDSDIRSAITADGATGSQACYAIIAMIEVAATTTTITDSLITISDATSKIITADNIDWTTINLAAKNNEKITVPYNSFVKVVSLDVSTIPNGAKIFIISVARLGWDSSSITFNWLFRDQDGNSLGSQRGYAPGQSWGFVATLTEVLTKTNDLDEISLCFQKQDNRGTPNIDTGAATIAVLTVS